MHARMTSEEADSLIRGAVDVLRKYAKGQHDNYYSQVITTLESVKESLPDHRVKDITDMLRHAYYHRVKINFKGGNQVVALDCAKKYLKLYPEAPADDKYYSEVQDIMLKIHGERVAKLKEKEATQPPKVQHPELPASIYRAHKSLHFDPPRSPEKFKITRSMAVKPIGAPLSKSYTKGSKSLKADKQEDMDQAPKQRTKIGKKGT